MNLTDKVKSAKKDLGKATRTAKLVADQKFPDTSETAAHSSRHKEIPVITHQTIMKTIISTLCLNLLAAASVFSFPMSDMIGSWSYQNRATQSDGEVLRTRGYIRVVRSSGNYIFKETNTAGDSVARYTMFRDGRFTLTQGPVVSAVGRWRKTTDAIRVSGNITTPLGTNRFSSTFTMPSDDELKIVQRVPDFETVSKWTARRARR